MQKKLLLVLSVLLVLLTTVAYSVLSTSLTISGEATIRAIADIRVNGIVLDSASGGTVAYDSKYNKNTITSGFTLPSAGSTISYRVQIDNTGDVDYTIYDILTTSSSNPGLSYTISGYNLRDVIQAKTSVSLVITYSTSQPSDSVINVINTFDFRRVYHVTYNTGTSQTISSQIKYENVDLTLTSTEPTKNGYTFSKWNTKSDGTGTNYNAGSTYTLNDDLDLYARYTLANYNITYVLNGGTNDPNNPSTYTITSNNITLGDASKTGYTFKGWTGNGTTTPTKNLVLAKGSYGDKTFTANFIDETGPTIAVTKTDGTGDYLANALNLNAGWNTSVGTISVGINAEDNGSGLNKVEYALTNSSTAPTTGWTETTNGTLNISNTARGTYYLHIKATDEDGNTTTVTTKAITVRYRVGYYDDYSASTSITTSQYYTGSALTTRTPTAVTGYTFEGWYSSTALTTKVVDAGVSYTPNKSIKLYGKWTATTYNITYAKNNGTVSPANPDTYNIESSAITLNNPTKTLTFKGNYNATSGANASSTSGVSLGSNTSQAQTFKGWSGTGLTGDSNTTVTIAAGSTGDRSYTAHYTAVAGNTPTVTRTGYTCGWNRSNSGTTIEINSGDPYPTSYITEDMGATVNLYAVCTPNTYSVTYDYNTGDARIGNNVYINTGYKFNWNNDFKLNSTINLPTAGQRYLLFGNYTTTSELNLELTTGNKMRVYSQGDKATSTGTLAANTDIQIEFIYTGSNKEFSLTSTGTSSNASASGTNDKSGLTGAPLRIGTDNRTNNTFKQYLLKAASITDYYDYGGTLSNLPTSPTRPGYTFGGWYTAASGGTQVTSSTSVPSANTTYYAHWTAKTYTLTINPQGGTYNSSTSNATKTMTYDSTNNNDIGVPTRDGYTFAGWYTSASGGTQIYGTNGRNVNASSYWTAAYSTGKWAYDNDLTVYAKWTKAVSNLTNSVSPTSYIYSGSANSPTPTVKDGSTTLTLNTDYTVSYSNNTNVGTATATITGAGVYNSTTKAFYTGTATINYYVNNAKITYNANSCGTITGTSPAYVKKGTTGVYTGIRNTTAGTVAGITATKGYTFNGWYDGNTKVINADGTIVASVSNWTDANKKWLITEDKTLTASCTANIYSVTLNSQDATTAGTAKVWYRYKTSNGSCYYYTDSTLTTCLTNSQITKPTKIGYNFGGYYVGTNGSGTNYVNTSGTFINNIYQTVPSDIDSSYTDNTTLYAKWDITSHTVTYNTTENGGTGTIAQATVNYGDPITLPSTGASKSGWTFVGWNTDKNATTALSSLNMGIDDVTLYAIYSKTVTATFSDNNGATVASNSANCTYYNKATSCQVTAPSVTAQSGFSLLGFNTSASATSNNSNYNTSTNKLTISNSGTWYPITRSSSQYSGTFTIQDSNAATKSGGTTSCYRYNGGNSCNITAPTLTAKTGYTVVGWNGTADSTTATYASGASISITANATFYSITYYNTPVTITFNRNNPPSKATSQTPSGGSASSDTSIDQTCTKYNGNGCSITSPTMTVTSGYHAVGYNTTSSASTSSWNANSSKTVSSNATYYAITTANTYSVKFNANCPSGSTASGSMSNQSMTYGVSANLTNNAYSCTGHIFAGWNSNAAGTGTSYTNGQSVSNLTTTNNGTYNIYGQWTKVWAKDLSYDNSLTGVDCEDSQCMIDCIEQIVKTGVCTPLSKGKYFTLQPDAVTATTTTAGFSGSTPTANQTLWRVIDVKSNGRVDAVSEYISTNGISVSGQNGYKNYVAGLQDVASKYAKAGYTVGTRMMGYDGQTAVLASTSAFDGSSTRAPSTTSTPDATSGTGTEYSGGALGDTLYLRDYKLVGDVYKTDTATYGDTGLIGYKLNGEKDEYWIASRKYRYYDATNFNFSALYMDVDGTFINNYPYHIRFYYIGGDFNGWTNGTCSYSIRPIITLRSGVTIASGTGTKNDPYILN